MLLAAAAVRESKRGDRVSLKCTRKYHLTPKTKIENAHCQISIGTSLATSDLRSFSRPPDVSTHPHASFWPSRLTHPLAWTPACPQRALPRTWHTPSLSTTPLSNCAPIEIVNASKGQLKSGQNNSRSSVLSAQPPPSLSHPAHPYPALGSIDPSFGSRGRPVHLLAMLLAFHNSLPPPSPPPVRQLFVRQKTIRCENFNVNFRCMHVTLEGGVGVALGGKTVGGNSKLACTIAFFGAHFCLRVLVLVLNQLPW